MTEAAVVQTLGQMGAVGIMGLAVLGLFKLLVASYEKQLTYVINQNAILREENKALQNTLNSMIPGYVAAAKQNASGTVTNLQSGD